MTKQDIGQIVAELTNSLEEPLRRRLERHVDDKVEAYRRTVWVRDEWCCNEMRGFAVQFWHAPKPRTDEMWGVQYQIRGFAVNYCPFCGAYAGPQATKP